MPNARPRAVSTATIMCSTCDSVCPEPGDPHLPRAAAAAVHSTVELRKRRAGDRQRRRFSRSPRDRRWRCSPTPATSAATVSPSAPPPTVPGGTSRASSSTAATSRRRPTTPSCSSVMTAPAGSRRDSMVNFTRSSRTTGESALHLICGRARSWTRILLSVLESDLRSRLGPMAI